MARYEVLGSDGHTYEVEAPTPEAAAQAVNTMLAQQQAGQPSLAQDVGMGGASGVARGVAGALDLPGQATGFLASQAGRLVEPVYERITGRDLPTEFYMQEAQRAIDMVSPFAPQGQTFTGAVEQAAPGLMAYEPATTAGEFAQTAGEFAPGMALTPGGPLARTMYGLVAPTIGAELGERGVDTGRR